jgi:uncharacterized membrane protein YeiH
MSLLGAASESVTGLDTDVERVLDLGGILVFAISGGLTAVRKEYDVVGVVALSLVTALGGGILRDLLLGDTPPVALRDTNYLVVPLVAAAIVSLFHGLVDRHLRRPGLVFDAAGLGLFAVTGTVKALSLGVNAVGSVVLGVITAVGGGLLRDVLAHDVPALFRADSTLFSIPAALGAIVVAIAWRADFYGGYVGALIALGVFAMRILALRYQWRGPRPRVRTSARDGGRQ